MPAADEDLGLADLRGADADRAAGELQLRDGRTLVRLRVRPAHDVHRGQPASASSRCSARTCRGRRTAPVCRAPTLETPVSLSSAANARISADVAAGACGDAQRHRAGS